MIRLVLSVLFSALILPSVNASQTRLLVAPGWSLSDGYGVGFTFSMGIEAQVHRRWFGQVLLGHRIEWIEGAMLEGNLPLYTAAVCLGHKIPLMPGTDLLLKAGCDYHFGLAYQKTRSFLFASGAEPTDTLQQAVISSREVFWGGGVGLEHALSPKLSLVLDLLLKKSILFSTFGLSFRI